MILPKLPLFVGTNFLWPQWTTLWTLVLSADPQLMTPRSQPRLPIRSRKWRTSVISIPMTLVALINNHVLYPKTLIPIPLLLLLLPYLLSCLQCLSKLSRISFLYLGIILNNRLLHPLLRRRCVIVHPVVLAKPPLFRMQSHPKNVATSRAKSNCNCWKPRWRWKVWLWGHLYNARNVTETWFSFEVIKVFRFPVLMLISLSHVDDQQQKNRGLLLIIYFLLHSGLVLYRPLYALYHPICVAFSMPLCAPFSLPSTFDVFFCSWTSSILSTITALTLQLFIVFSPIFYYAWRFVCLSQLLHIYGLMSQYTEVYVLLTGCRSHSLKVFSHKLSGISREKGARLRPCSY